MHGMLSFNRRAQRSDAPVTWLIRFFELENQIDLSARLVLKKLNGLR